MRPRVAYRLLFLGGIGLVTSGLALIALPIALVAGGVLVIALASIGLVQSR